MKRTLIMLGVLLTSLFATLTIAGTAQADTNVLYNEYTNPDLCMIVGQNGVSSGQWIYYYCQEVAPEGVSHAGQWDLWVEYAD
jgi:hypothetical protein